MHGVTDAPGPVGRDTLSKRAMENRNALATIERSELARRQLAFGREMERQKPMSASTRQFSFFQTQRMFSGRTYQSFDVAFLCRGKELNWLARKISENP